MQANTDEGKEIFPHDREDTVSEIVTGFVEAVDAPESATEPFVELVEGLVDQLDEATQEAAQARERAREAEERADDLAEDVDVLEEELQEERATRAKEAAEDRKRLSNVEERLESGDGSDSADETPTPETERTTLHEPETPLEEVVQLPEHLAEDNLSANQQRARFVAKDVHQYTRDVPAGRAIKSSELRRVLSAGEEGRVYTETVGRVINFLTDLGGDSVEVNETKAGERVVVFSDEFVRRVVAYHNQNNAVVTDEGVTG